MAIFNLPAWKTRFDALKNGTSPFTSSSPRMRKEDHGTVVGLDLADSVLFKLPVEFSISNPSSSFTVDFSLGDQALVSTTGSSGSSFNITLSGLHRNVSGKIRVTKETSDVVNFTNGVILPIDDTADQVGKTVLYFHVYNNDGAYQVLSGYERTMKTSDIVNLSVTESKIGNGAISDPKLDEDISLMRLNKGNINRNVYRTMTSIPAWNMQTSANSQAIFSSIENIPVYDVFNYGATIFSDGQSGSFPIDYGGTDGIRVAGSMNLGSFGGSSKVLFLRRCTEFSFFNSANFNSTNHIRGYAYIDYFA